MQQDTYLSYRRLAAVLALGQDFAGAKQAMWASQLPHMQFQPLDQVSFLGHQKPLWLTQWGAEPHLPGNAGALEGEARHLYEVAGSSQEKPYMVAYYILMGQFGFAIQAMLEWELKGSVFGTSVEQ